MKKIWLTLTGLIIAIGCVISLWLFTLFTPVVLSDQGINYYLRPGMSKKALIADLSQQGVVIYPSLFALYTYTQNNAQLKTGEYHFAKNTNLITVWKQVTTGTGLVYHHFTIVPGWSFAQLRRELLKAPALHHSVASMDDKQLMEKLGLANVAPEGEFFPDTYFYTRGNDDFTILKRAFDLMQTRFTQAWNQRAPNLPYKNPYEALIAASLVEKEAYLNAERPVIAGVLINRLRKDMLLQFDPTVIYGMGDRYAGKIHKEDLQTDTPYNTYVHKGLPPTPIAMPGMTSIQAVMHPLESDYLYFVARGDGSHQFSNTLPEHNAAVSVLIKRTSGFNEKKVREYVLRALARAEHPITHPIREM